MADALDLESSIFDVGVQVPSSAPMSSELNRVRFNSFSFSYSVIISSAITIGTAIWYWLAIKKNEKSTSKNEKGMVVQNEK